MGAISDKLKGKAKQIGGRLTDDPDLETEGELQETKGKVEAAASRVVRKVKRGVRRVQASVSRANRSARTR